MFAIAASCSQPPHFFLFYTLGGTQNKGEKVAQFPPLGSHTPRETHPRPNTLSTHAQCLASLSDLHMSPSSSLIHRHTVELFKPLRWGAAKHHCYCAGGSLVSRSYSCCLPLKGRKHQHLNPAGHHSNPSNTTPSLHFTPGLKVLRHYT